MMKKMKNIYLWEGWGFLKSVMLFQQLYQNIDVHMIL